MRARAFVAASIALAACSNVLGLQDRELANDAGADAPDARASADGSPGAGDAAADDGAREATPDATVCDLDGGALVYESNNGANDWRYRTDPASPGSGFGAGQPAFRLAPPLAAGAKVTLHVIRATTGLDEAVTPTSNEGADAGYVLLDGGPLGEAFVDPLPGTIEATRHHKDDTAPHHRIFLAGDVTTGWEPEPKPHRWYVCPRR